MTYSLHVIYGIIDGERMFDIIEVVNEIQAFVLREIIVCESIAEGKPFSECADASYEKGNSVFFLRASCCVSVFAKLTKYGNSGCFILFWLE